MRLRFTALTFAVACTPSPLVSRTLEPALTPSALAADCATITPSSSSFSEPVLPTPDVPSMPDETGCNVTISPKSDRCFSGTATSWMLSLPLLPALPLSPSPLPATVKSPDSMRTSRDDVTRPSDATFVRIADASESSETTIRSYW